MYSFRSVFPHMEVPVVASYDRHGVPLGLFYSSAADKPLLSPVPTGGVFHFDFREQSKVAFRTPV